MNDTHKLLLAFIDAMGYEVETVTKTKQWYVKEQLNNGKPKDGEAPWNETTEDEYKVTKKEVQYSTECELAKGLVDAIPDLYDAERKIKVKK